MPKLLQRTRQVVPSAQSGIRSASGEDFGGDGGLGALGQGVSAAGDIMFQRQERDESLERELRIADDRLKWSDRIAQLQKELPHGGVGIDNIIQKELNDYQGGAAESFKTNRASSAYIAQFNDLKTQLVSKANGVAAVAAAAKERAVLTETFDTLLNTVRADPAQAQSAIEQQTRMINSSPGLSEGIKSKWVNEQSEKVWGNAVEGEIGRTETPEQANALLTSLKQEAWQKRLSPADYSSAMGKLETKVKRLSAQRETEFMEGFAEANRELANGIGLDTPLYTEADIKENIQDPIKQKEMIRSLRQASELGEVYSDVKLSSDSDRKKMAASFIADMESQGDFDLDTAKLKTLKRAFDMQKKNYDSDPVDYTTKMNSEVQSAREAWTENPSPDTLDKFAITTITEQMRQGTDPRDVKLLAAVDVEQVKVYMRDIDEAGSPQQVSLKLQELSKRYGKYWPIVNKQLQTGGAITSNTAIMASMDRPNQLSASEELGIADGITDKEFEAIIPEFKIVKKEVFNNVQTALTPLIKSMEFQVGREGQVASYTAAVSKLAMYRISKGMDMSEAVEQSAKDIVIDSYDFAPTFRMPRGIPESFGAVEAGTRRALQTIDLSDMMPFQSLIMTDEKSRMEASIRTVRSSGVWVTNSDETGLVLADDRGNAVLKKDGTTYEMTWGQAAKMDVFDDGPGYETLGLY